jgi:hypothetical protein
LVYPGSAAEEVDQLVPLPIGQTAERLRVSDPTLAPPSLLVSTRLAVAVWRKCDICRLGPESPELTLGALPPRRRVISGARAQSEMAHDH